MTDSFPPEPRVGYRESLDMPDPVGYLVNSNQRESDPIEVARTKRNRYFFFYHQTRLRFEVACPSQGIVIDTLRAAQERKSPTRLAFFDREGNFYDDVALSAFSIDKGEANFVLAPESENPQPFTTKFGNIACVSAAQPPEVQP